MAQGWAAIKNTGEIPQHVNLPKCWRRVSPGLLLIAIKPKDFISEWWRNRERNNPTWFESMPHWLENDRSWECFSLRVIMVLNPSMKISTTLPLTATEDYNVWNVSVSETPPPSTTSWSLWGLVRLSLCRHNYLSSVSVLHNILMIMCDMC